LPDANLAGSRRGHIDGFINQDLRAPHFVHEYGLGHVGFSLGILLGSSESY
jgi:hypothetical protein